MKTLITNIINTIREYDPLIIVLVVTLSIIVVTGITLLVLVFTGVITGETTSTTVTTITTISNCVRGF